MSEDPNDYEVLVHRYGNTATWTFLVNVTIILAALRFSRIAAFVHMLIGLSMFVTTYFFILWFLFPYGFIEHQKEVFYYYLHAILGCALLGLIVIIVGTGLFTRFYVDSAFSHSLKKGVKIFHRYFAYIVVVVFKVNLTYNWYQEPDNTFTIIIIWEVISVLVWAYVKFFFRDIQGVVLDNRTKIGGVIAQAKKTSDIKEYSKPYVIYNNYVYDASDLVKHHPGGKKVIQTILGREVDRFLYGMYASELLPSVLPHSHSVQALYLLKEPVMRIATPAPFSNFDQEAVPVRIQFISEVSKKTGIYVLGLASKQDDFEFEFAGYSDVKQLGQYYSFTMNNKITRLYTAVNLITKQNIQLINKLIPNLKYDIQEKITEKFEDFTNKKSENKSSLLQGATYVDSNYLPLMIKSYPTGKLSCQIIQPHFSQQSFLLSQPKGLGLEIEVTKPGKIVIMAGGTGLFPFSDFIDLLFKAVYIENNSNNRAQILEKNPILKQNPFDKFRFVLLAAINEPQDIHPITFQQVVYLSSNSSKFKTVLRVAKNEKELQKLAGKIEFTSEFFTNRVVSEAASMDFSRVWICGPPRMASDTAEALLRNGVSREGFLLL